MAKIEYLVAERRRRYGDQYSFYASGYGFSDYEPQFLSKLGRDGWELVSDSGTEMRFKRVIEEEPEEDYSYNSQPTYYENNYAFEDSDSSSNIDYTEQLNIAIKALTTGLIAIDEHLVKLQAQQMIFCGLLQALVEKFCPDSEFLLALKDEMGLANLSGNKSAPSAATKESAETSDIQETAEISDDDTFTEEKMISGFADEFIELVMNGYQDEDKSLHLFSCIVGFGTTVPTQTEENHRRYMLKAFYRYYEKHNDSKVLDCFNAAMDKAARYLSSSTAIGQINEISNSSMTTTEAVDAFFNIVSAQLAFEKAGSSPFTVTKMREYISSFISKVKDNSDPESDAKLLEKAQKQATLIAKKYGIEISTD